MLGDVQRTVDGIQATAHLIGLPSQSHLKVARVRSPESDSARAQSELASRIIKDCRIASKPVHALVLTSDRVPHTLR